MAEAINNLKQSLQIRLEDVLTSMPVGVAWADIEEGRIQFVNHRFVELFGYDLQDLGTVSHWIRLAYADPAQGDYVEAFWRRQRRDPLADARQIDEIELDIRCRDGSIKTVLSSKIHLPDEHWALSTFVDITPLKSQENLIKQQALEDPLTGLLNRRAFDSLLAEALAEGRGLALLLIDLDGFKPVNDSLGHHKGDHLLRQVADRLREAMRDGDAICRIGGDEFCVVARGLRDKILAASLAERLIKVVSKPYRLGHVVVKLGASVGLAMCPEDASDAIGLYKHADRALYRAKDAGRGVWSR